MTKRIAMIGSMRYPELFERARRDFGQGADCRSPTEVPQAENAMIGDWHHIVDWADEVIVVPKPDGTLGAGTVAELRLATGTGKPIVWAG